MDGILSNPMALGGIVVVVAVIGYLVYAYMQKKWPFA